MQVLLVQSFDGLLKKLHFPYSAVMLVGDGVVQLVVLQGTGVTDLKREGFKEDFPLPKPIADAYRGYSTSPSSFTIQGQKNAVIRNLKDRGISMKVDWPRFS